MTLRIDSEVGVRKNLDTILGWLWLAFVLVDLTFVAYGVCVVVPRHASRSSAVAAPIVQPFQHLSSDSSTPPELPPWLEGLPEGYVAASDPHDAKWSATVKRLNREEPDVTCAACGGTEAINWHHVDAWHNCTGKNEWKRYDRSNLIPLCNSPVRKCHWIFGHLGVSWSAINPHVREHAAEHLKAVTEARAEMAESKKRHDAMSKRTLAP